MENINNIIKENILKSYGIDIEKSSSVPGLIAKKVQITKKDGSTYYAIRHVSSQTGQSQRIIHPKYRHEDDLHGEGDQQKIQNIVNNDELKPLDKVRSLASLGIYDKQTLSDLSEHKYPADIPSLLKKEAGIDQKDLDNPNKELAPITQPEDTPYPDLDNPVVQKMAISQIESQLGSKAAFSAQEDMRQQLAKEFGVTVNDKWNAYESRLNRLIKDGFPKAVMAYGTGGVGKTFTFEKLAETNKLIEYDPELDMERNGDEYDFIKIGGKIGSREMQRALYEHSDKLIVFDDCDSMWNDEGLINVLKNVLDTSGGGKCQWAQRLPETSKGLGDEVPSRFKFEGRMLFITNLSKKQLNERGASPIAESRASSIDLTMDMDQTIDRLTDILPYVKIKDYKGVTMSLTDEDKSAGMEALRSVKQYARVDQLNTRTLGKILGEAREQRETKGEYNQRDLTVFALQEFGLV